MSIHRGSFAPTGWARVGAAEQAVAAVDPDSAQVAVLADPDLAQVAHLAFSQAVLE